MLGRGLTERDNKEAPKVAVINETAAKKFFPNRNPIGGRFGPSVETAGQIEVVGVLRDAKYDSVRDTAPPTMYVPFLQKPCSRLTAGSPTAAVGLVLDVILKRLMLNLPVTDVRPSSNSREAIRAGKVFAQAYTLFGSLALRARVGRACSG